MQLLSRHGIGLPVTGYAHSTHDVPDLITMVGGAPLWPRAVVDEWLAAQEVPV